jgi:hypothetical protein
MKKLFKLIFSASLFFLHALSLKAAGILPEAGYSDGDYGLNDFMLLAINVSNIILRFVGTLALLMFVYGGLTFLLSAGNNEQVAKGKKILIAAVIGIVIVLTSFVIIQFALKSVGINWDGGLIPT